jgi:hypothetical protein
LHHLVEDFISELRVSLRHQIAGDVHKVNTKLVECLRDNLVEKTQSLAKKSVLLAHIGGTLPQLVINGDFSFLVNPTTSSKASHITRDRQSSSNNQVETDGYRLGMNIGFGTRSDCSECCLSLGSTGIVCNRPSDIWYRGGSRRGAWCPCCQRR